jgi:broad specificity phosphatase PhoE
MNTDFYIFRHGQTFATQAGTGYGIRVFSAPILPQGIPALKKLGEHLASIPTDYQTTSAIKMCVQTTDIVSGITGRPFTKDKRLNEYFLETFSHFRRRMEDVLHDIEQKRYKRVAICTHGAGIATLTGLLTKKKVQPSDLFLFPEPGRLLVIKNGNLQEINFNE